MHLTFEISQPISFPRECRRVLLSTLRGDRVVYQSLLRRGAAEAHGHAVVSRIARNSARTRRQRVRMGPRYPVNRFPPINSPCGGTNRICLLALGSGAPTVSAY
eukprot:4086034-Prymnesium_polylepis.1